MRRAAVVVAVLALAGCGGTGKHPAAGRPPRLPRALARTWATEAQSVAQSLAAGDGCGAQQRANRLRGDVVAALSRHEVPRRFQETLISAVTELPLRIACTPAPPPPRPMPPDGRGFRFGHHHRHGHGGRGR